MTQEQKELLLRDLCMRLPYGVKVKIKHYDYEVGWKLLAIYTNGTTYATRDIGYPIETYFEDCKPYLFPLSSMTEEQRLEYYGTFSLSGDISGSIDFYNKYHLDWRGLIPMGLANDATGLNIY